jgi:hypothetical protein
MLPAGFARQFASFATSEPLHCSIVLGSFHYGTDMILNALFKTALRACSSNELGIIIDKRLGITYG